MPPVVTVGSAVLDRIYPVTNLPESDGGAFARDERTAAGGVAANVAVALSRLGRETGVVSRVGRDDDGDQILASLADEGVEATRIGRGDERSSYTMILRDDDGRRMIIAGGESVPALRLDDADLDYCRDADAVFTSAYAPDPVVSRLVEAAREDDDFPPLAFDLAGPLAELEGRGTRPETIDELLPVVDLFLSSEVPIRSYLGCDGPDAATELRARGVSRLALTRGADGALLADFDGNGDAPGAGDASGADDAGALVDVPAFEVDAVDTTGAGDAFSAGLVDAWLLDGRSASEAGRFAARVAAENCTGEGARGGLPTRDAVRRRR